MRRRDSARCPFPESMVLPFDVLYRLAPSPLRRLCGHDNPGPPPEQRQGRLDAAADYAAGRRTLPARRLAFGGSPRHGAAMDQRITPAETAGTGPDLSGTVRRDWTRADVRALFELPFPDLIYHAQRILRAHFDPREVQLSTLLSIKTGGCREGCACGPESACDDTGVKADKLMDVEPVGPAARAGRGGGARRFCMGAAWRNPKDRDLDRVCTMV